MDNPFRRSGYVIVSQDIDKFFNELGKLLVKKFYGEINEKESKFYLDSDLRNQFFQLIKKYQIPSSFLDCMRNIFETNMYLTFLYDENGLEKYKSYKNPESPREWDKFEREYKCFKKKYKIVGDIFEKMKKENNDES